MQAAPAYEAPRFSTHAPPRLLLLCLATSVEFRFYNQGPERRKTLTTIQRERDCLSYHRRLSKTTQCTLTITPPPSNRDTFLQLRATRRANCPQQNRTLESTCHDNLLNLDHATDRLPSPTDTTKKQTPQNRLNVRKLVRIADDDDDDDYLLGTDAPKTRSKVQPEKSFLQRKIIIIRIRIMHAEKEMIPENRCGNNIETDPVRLSVVGSAPSFRSAHSLQHSVRGASYGKGERERDDRARVPGAAGSVSPARFGEPAETSVPGPFHP